MDVVAVSRFASRFLRLAGRTGLTLTVVAACADSYAGAQWVSKPGSGWASLTVFHHATDSRFDEGGAVESLFNEGGESISTSIFLTGVVGVVRGVDVWFQAPFHRLEFNDVVEDRLSTGFGDPRFHVRIGPGLFTNRSPPLPLALRFGVKLPVSDFPIDTEVIPIGEGQRDWEAILETGISFWPNSTYLSGWIGYRWREPNEEIRRDFGDEVFFLVSGGGRIRAWSWKLSVEGLFGRAHEVFGLTIRADRRELVQVMPSIGRQTGPGIAELGLRLPLAGRNLPSGPAVFLGYFLSLGGR